MAPVTDPNNDFPSDEELEDILLSNDEKPIRQVKDPSNKEPAFDLSHLSKKKGPVKLKRLNKKKKKEDSSEPKRPRGRPKIWTDEKKSELLAKKKSKSKEKRDQKKHIEQLTKISLNQGFGPAERKRVAETVKQQREKIETEILLQRKQEKEIQEYTNFTPKCEHFDKFSHIDMSGHFISTCIHCSRSRKWDPQSWDRYWSKAKREIK